MRSFLRTKRQKRLATYKSLKHLLFFYKKIQTWLANVVVELHSYYKSCFYITLPKRQQHFTVYDISKAKQRVFSAGQFLNVFGKRAKFFKRNIRSLGGIVLQMKNAHQAELGRLYFFSLKNFNFRQYVFFKKFTELLKPDILYFLHKRSYIPTFNRKRRIKRSVLKLLGKQ